jgi:hypothetical protein
MKHIHTFETFVNENLNEGLWHVVPSEHNPEMLTIKEPNDNQRYTGPTIYWDSKKGGAVESYDGSHGQETRIIVKCTEEDCKNALTKAAKEFENPQSADYNSYFKKVKDFIKKNV